MKMVHSLFTIVWGLSDSFIAQKEETEAQSGGNGRKMMLPLIDTLNGPKYVENGALSLHNSLWTIRLFHRRKRRKQNPKVEETVRRWCYI